MSDLRKPAQEETDGNEHQRIRSSATIEYHNLLALETILASDNTASTSGAVQDGGMEDFYADIFNELSNVELPSTLPEQAIVTSSINVPSVSKQQILEEGESSGVKKTKSTAIEESHSDDENQRKNSKRIRRDDRPPRSRSAQLHNMSERVRRDRIRRKMKALQDLIPSCNTRDKASMLDDAIMCIKSLQNQILMMSTGAGAMLQNPYALQAGYQGAQLPQFPSQFMPMRPGIGMGMYGMSSSTALPVMPFPLASPCQSNLSASGMAMVGPMTQMQLPLNPFQPLPSADSGSTLMAAQTSYASLVSTLLCTTQAETSSLSVARAAKVPLMNQGPIVSGSSAVVLPSQIITSASSSSTSIVAEVPLHPGGRQQ